MKEMVEAAVPAGECARRVYDKDLEKGTARSANVIGVRVDALNLEQALQSIEARLRRGPKGYVCAVDVHGILAAIRDAAVADALHHAAFALPDGTPTVWVGRAQGNAGMSHVTGPSVMWEVFGRDEFAGYSHFLYGGKPGVAEELASILRRQFPWTKIIGTFTPPFRELTPAEEGELVETIGRLRPDIVWVGIGTPRQDLWMRRMLPRLETRMMFGVGAAFDFLTGHIRMCPGWIKRAGLHWLHRLLQDPVRLWRRNVGNLAFLWYISLQLTGVKVRPIVPCDRDKRLPRSIYGNAAQEELLDRKSVECH